MFDLRYFVLPKVLKQYTSQHQCPHKWDIMQFICLKVDETDTYEILLMILLEKLSCIFCLLAFEAQKTEEYCNYEWGSH